MKPRESRGLCHGELRLRLSLPLFTLPLTHGNDHSTKPLSH